jgi:hypothetical protein
VQKGSKFKNFSPINSARRALQNEYHIMLACGFDPWPIG